MNMSHIIPVETILVLEKGILVKELKMNIHEIHFAVFKELQENQCNWKEKC